MIKKTLLAGVAALSMGGATLTMTAPAEAQVYFGTGTYWGGSPYWGHRHVGYYPYHHRYHYRRSNNRAVAAGLIGGLALGALAANAARPAYYYPTATVASSCWIERQRLRDRFGRRVIRDVQVCG